MPITITNIQIKEVNISQQGNDYTVSVSYSFLDNDNKEVAHKRTDFKDFNTTQKLKINDILIAVSNKIKTLENI